MSSEDHKIKHSKRLHEDENAIRKQMRIAKEHKMTEYNVNTEQPHRYHKQHAMNCGNPKCFMCGNPRKVFKERTYQEKKQMQPLINNDMGE